MSGCLVTCYATASDLLQLCTGEVVWLGQGAVKDTTQEVAELRGVLEGLEKAQEHGVLELVLCLRSQLLRQVRLGL